MSLEKIIDEYKTDNEIVHKFCNDLYDMTFKDSFTKIHEMYDRIKSNIHPVTDSELEYIITTFPLELMMVSERLNELRLDYQVIKLKNKEKLECLRQSFVDTANSMDELNKTEKQEWINHQMVQVSVEYEVILAAYGSVITRVENEQSFARELIMGSKKVWDSRRASENVNPIGPTVPELPEYNRTKQYVK